MKYIKITDKNRHDYQLDIYHEAFYFIYNFFMKQFKCLTKTCLFLPSVVIVKQYCLC